MRFLIRGVAGVVVLAVLALAGYGAWALLIDNAPSSTASTQAVREVSPEPDALSTSQASWQDEMAEVCTRHMAEMQPVMEQMMRDMMSDMMDGMVDGGGGGGMMDDGMIGGGMMSQ